MPIDPAALKAWERTVPHRHAETDVMLHALTMGVGADPEDGRQLRYVYERNLTVLPSFAIVIGDPGFWVRDPAYGLDWVRTVLSSMQVSCEAPLPVAGELVGRNRVAGLADRGPGKGALLTVEREIRDTAGRRYATVSYTALCRGDGGFATPDRPGDPPPPPLPAVPDRAPDQVETIVTRPETALLHRLLVDRNPLHADPAVAQAAGFPRPILHGHATLGLAAHAVLRGCCDYRAERLASFGARFAAPVFPGDRLTVELWREGAEVAFQARREDGTVVLSHGRAGVRAGQGANSSPGRVE